VLPHTPEYFCFYSLPYGYDPDAKPPDWWFKLVNDQWGDDPQSIETLYEEFGYLLTPDVSLQKIFLWIGPPRSGRSTIKDVLTQLIGPMNVAATSPVALGDTFGLEPLLNKTVAIMGDARTSDTHDMAVMVDRLVRISGRDPVEVNRKGRAILSNVHMPLRLLIISNEMPMFRDSSGAVTSRYLIHKANKTIPVEDRINNLLDLIVAGGLPGILNLSIEGLQRLRRRGRFIQPESAADLIDLADEIASPAKSFAGACLVLDPDSSTPTFDTFLAWSEWADRNGFNRGNSASLGKNLKAAIPSIKKPRPRNEEGRQEAVYTGIMLNELGSEFLVMAREKRERGQVKSREFTQSMKEGWDYDPGS
jgi:putative DNA primase/helicase